MPLASECGRRLEVSVPRFTASPCIYLKGRGPISVYAQLIDVLTFGCSAYCLSSHNVHCLPLSSIDCLRGFRVDGPEHLVLLRRRRQLLRTCRLRIGLGRGFADNAREVGRRSPPIPARIAPRPSYGQQDESSESTTFISTLFRLTRCHQSFRIWWFTSSPTFSPLTTTVNTLADYNYLPNLHLGRHTDASLISTGTIRRCLNVRFSMPLTVTAR